MVLFLHISVALVSLVYSTFTAFMPSTIKINVSQTLIIATLISGTYIVLSTHASMVHACITGLIYLSVASFEVGLASLKLKNADSASHS
jgi:hypothetical protein